MSGTGKILKVVGRSIYDSRGNPTVEVDVWTSKGEE
jgi:enolase